MRGGYKEEDGGFENESLLFQTFQKEISWILVQSMIKTL